MLTLLLPYYIPSSMFSVYTISFILAYPLVILILVNIRRSFLPDIPLLLYHV